jgi:hypothetical protein
MEAGQLDLSLSVAVCAWCKPRVPMGEIGALSHGICPRHLRKVKLELQGVVSRRRRRAAADKTRETLLPF